MRTLDAVSRWLADPAVLAILGAVTIAVLVAARLDFSWRERRETRRLAKVERRAHDEDGRRRPLGVQR